MNFLSSTMFSITLSVSELQWLAGAFGLARLPLRLIETSQERVFSDGHTSLLERDIIRNQGKRWQVQPFAAMLIPWMTNAKQHWQFRRTLRNGQESFSSLFLLDTLALLVFSDATENRFIAYQTAERALQEWQDMSGLTFSSTSEGLPIWDVPQPIVIIRSVWKNPDLAATMADASFFQWADGLDWIAEWSRISGQDRVLQLSLVGTDGNLWVGQSSQGRPGESILKPVSGSELTSLINNIMQIAI